VPNDWHLSAARATEEKRKKTAEWIAPTGTYLGAGRVDVVSGLPKTSGDRPAAVVFLFSSVAAMPARKRRLPSLSLPEISDVSDVVPSVPRVQPQQLRQSHHAIVLRMNDRPVEIRRVHRSH
jgi:hypothetical protein